jgi:hypothetical protein
MKIGIVASGSGGVEYHRLLKPFSLLNGEYDITRCEGISSDAFDYGFDVVVFSSNPPYRQSRKEFILATKVSAARMSSVTLMTIGYYHRIT